MTDSVKSRKFVQLKFNEPFQGEYNKILAVEEETEEEIIGHTVAWSHSDTDSPPREMGGNNRPWNFDEEELELYNKVEVRKKDIPLIETLKEADTDE